MENIEKIDKIRHSLSHLLAAAVLKKFPDTKFGIGPVIENGFYYDFDLPRPITEEELKDLEKEMRNLIKAKLPFTREVLTIEEAKKIFSAQGGPTWGGKDQPFKLDLIEEFSKTDKEVSIYKTGDVFFDLCRGGHVENTKEINPDTFTLLKIAGAYWRGDEKNKMLTRIYGLAFETKKELDEYLAFLEEAKKRDHRVIGQDLKLFVFSDLVGKGLPTFGPNGATIKRELERFTIDEELKRGYHHIVTPDLAKVDLYKKSGHYPYYKDSMYPVMKIDDEELILKPMTCPHHFMFYKSERHSYRELPYRIGEIAHQYRYEKSGELSGLTRVRMFCLADAHIIATKDQAGQVIKEVLELIDFINETLGLVKGVDYRYRLSLGDRSDNKKYYKDDVSWDSAENVLRKVLTETKAPFFEAENEAAFYGPKIDIQMKRVNGKEETAFTVQYDFVMPERFDLTFINQKGEEERPIVIHRSSIGCLERTMAFLIERYAGAFPVWLSPNQVTILPISEKFMSYGEEVQKMLKKRNIRVEMSEANETLGKRIREAEMKKTPYILVVGEKEESEKMVNVRKRHQKETSTIPIAQFIDDITKEIQEKK